MARVALVTHAASGGGAGIACARLHKALQLKGISSELLTARSWPSADPRRLKRLRLQSIAVSQIERRILRLQRTSNIVHHSLGYLSSGYGRLLREHEAEIIHLHWINNGLLSLADLMKLTKPTVWTLHDMWAFCGAEHYIGSYADERFAVGYKHSRPADEGGLPINEWVWKYKRAHQLHKLVYVAPSRWMAQQAAKSVLLREARIEVIPNGLDVDFWSPAESTVELRRKLGVAADQRVVLFASAAGYKEWRKGHDLLEKAITDLCQTFEGKLCVVNLGGRPTDDTQANERVQFRGTGFLDSEERTREWYRVADVVVIPSRLDNFPNVALEAMACGVPCCAFDSGGVSEAIFDGMTGYVFCKEDTAGLAKGIARLLDDVALHRRLSLAARDRATSLYSLAAFGQAHSALYDDIVDGRSLRRHP